MWQIEQLPLADARLITLPKFNDIRGSFVKAFHESTLKEAGIDFVLRESYFSFSKKDVIRGMHFQLPPHQHSKIVYCPQGAILDIIIDLRKSSPTYLQYFASVLSADNHKAYYIPEGFAHGFKSLQDDSLTYYLVSSEHSQAHDTGIRFDSFGYDWQMPEAILSARDLSFPELKDFRSLF